MRKLKGDCWIESYGIFMTHENGWTDDESLYGMYSFRPVL